MIFGWDTYYLPRWQYGLDEFFLRISHDSYVNVVTRTKQTLRPSIPAASGTGLLSEAVLNSKMVDFAVGHKIKRARYLYEREVIYAMALCHRQANSGCSDANARPATRFAFKLFGQLAAAAATQNIVISPASVMLCLGMFQEGATGETKEAIAETLEIAELGSAAAHYLKWALHLREPSMELVVANSLWCDERFTPRPEYAANLREYFESEINVLDFRAPESVAKSNTWVSERTRGKIGHILE